MSTPRIGESARRSRTVMSRDIASFTEITGDRKPIHYDAQAAGSSRFGGIVVQGGVTTGLLNALVAQQLPGPRSVILQVSWRFLDPVRPGDVTCITAQDGVVVLDGSAVVWRDPSIAAAVVGKERQKTAS